MPSPRLHRPGLREGPDRGGRPDQGGPGRGVTPVPTWPEPEETLVADARGRVTPAQRVDQRLLALLGDGHPGLFLQASGRPTDIRKTFGK